MSSNTFEHAYRDSASAISDSDNEMDHSPAPLVMSHISAPVAGDVSTPVTGDVSAPATIPSLSADTPPLSTGRRRPRSPDPEDDDPDTMAPKRIGIALDKGAPLLRSFMMRLSNMEISMKEQNDRLADQDRKITFQDARIATQEEKVSKV